MLSHFSCIWLCVTLWTVACQVPLSMRFSRQEYWNGLLCPPPGDRPDPGTEPMSLFSPALAGGFFTTSTTWEAPEDTDHSYHTGKAAAALPRSLLIPWISSELPCLLTFLYPPPSFCLLYSWQTPPTPPTNTQMHDQPVLLSAKVGQILKCKLHSRAPRRVVHVYSFSPFLHSSPIFSWEQFFNNSQAPGSLAHSLLLGAPNLVNTHKSFLFVSGIQRANQ